MAPSILSAARFYHETGRWRLYLMVLMPDHLHALISFPQEPGMSRTVAAWKHYLSTHHGLTWQDNFFDHRLRNDEEFTEKMSYLRMNPVRQGLCDKAEDWPWVLLGEG